MACRTKCFDNSLVFSSCCLFILWVYVFTTSASTTHSFSCKKPGLLHQWLARGHYRCQQLSVAISTLVTRGKLKTGTCYLMKERPEPKGECRSGQTCFSRKPLKSSSESQAPDPGDDHLAFIGPESPKQIVSNKHLSVSTTKEKKKHLQPNWNDTSLSEIN